MKLSIKPDLKNKYPVAGLLVKSTNPNNWAVAIAALGLSLTQLKIYPLPDTLANSVWGCVIIWKEEFKLKEKLPYEFILKVHPSLYLSEKTSLYPKLSEGDFEDLFKSKKHVFHPEFGMVQLEEEFNWVEALSNPISNDVTVIEPSTSVFIPEFIKSFQIESADPEKVLEELEKKAIGEKKTFEDKPLNTVEKIKHFIYDKVLFRNKKDKKDKEVSGSGVDTPVGEGTEKSKFSTFLENLMGGTPKWIEKMASDFEDLDKRNQSEVNKLIDMLEKDPEEALKYALPLDSPGLSRGEDPGGAEYKISRLRGDLSNNGNSGGSGGPSVDLGDSYYTLQNQYNKMADDFIAKGEFQKASFIYLKLLKNYHLAAKTLEDGGLYQEAASVYLKHCKDKNGAARCYEKAKDYQEAIELLKELNENEKVAELYLKIRDKKQAMLYFEKYAEVLVRERKYVKAALVYREKMNAPSSGQELLLKGWENRSDEFNCLNNYFRNIEDEKQLNVTIPEVYYNHVNEVNVSKFLNVLEYEFKRSTENKSSIRDLAYVIVSSHLKRDKSLSSSLMKFNPEDKQLVKDVLRFKGK